jgi:hypothetical protein
MWSILSHVLLNRVVHWIDILLIWERWSRVSGTGCYLINTGVRSSILRMGAFSSFSLLIEWSLHQVGVILLARGVMLAHLPLFKLAALVSVVSNFIGIPLLRRYYPVLVLLVNPRIEWIEKKFRFKSSHRFAPIATASTCRTITRFSWLPSICHKLSHIHSWVVSEVQRLHLSPISISVFIKVFCCLSVRMAILVTGDFLDDRLGGRVKSRTHASDVRSVHNLRLSDRREPSH